MILLCAQYQSLRAEAEENMVRTEILKTRSARREAARAEVHDQLSSTGEGSGART